MARTLTITPRRALTVPVEVETLSPDFLQDRTISEIESLPTWEGNRRREFRSLFEVNEGSHGDTDEVTLVLRGDFSKVKRIGKAMEKGSIIVQGNAGMYLGEDMKGGSIRVEGHSLSWAGTKMKGGIIEVDGDTGDFLGASYRGSTIGMKGGLITIKGNAGNEVGCWMGDGTIIVRGNVGLFPGMHMKKGTILVAGSSQGRAGASMTGGRVVCLGNIGSILPSFLFDEVRRDVKVGDQRIQGPFYVFSGDATERGEGRLYASVQNNAHLKEYERFVEE